MLRQAPSSTRTGTLFPYSTLCRSAVVVGGPGGYAAWKLQKRNEWMVDHADELVALWDGSRSGTGNCVAYANTSGKPVVNLWPSWERRRNAPSEAPVDPSAACRR